jgi:hypothetical protein
VPRRDWIGICFRKASSCSQLDDFKLFIRLSQHTILATLHCCLASIWLQWRRWRRSLGVVDGAGDYANKVISDVRTVELLGKTGIPPTFTRRGGPVSDIDNNIGIMLVAPLGINGTINGPISSLSVPSLQGGVKAEVAKARAKERTKPRRPTRQSHNLDPRLLVFSFLHLLGSLLRPQRPLCLVQCFQQPPVQVAMPNSVAF